MRGLNAFGDLLLDEVHGQRKLLPGQLAHLFGVGQRPATTNRGEGDRSLNSDHTFLPSFHILNILLVSSFHARLKVLYESRIREGNLKKVICLV